MATWLITGCSTGLGRALARTVLAHGHNAVVTARDVTTLEDISAAFPDTALALSLDVTDRGQITTVVQQAQTRFGSIDVLVNNAGYGYRSAVEEATDDDIRQLFDTNVFGAVNMIKAVLPGMRAKRSGSIVNISSIGARISPPGSGYYSATKSALEGLSRSLRKELQPLGIHVTTIEPGGFRTDFAGRSLTQSATAIEDYAETAGKRRKENDSMHGTQPGDPVKAAEAMLAIVESPVAPSIVVLGSDAFSTFVTVAHAELTELDLWRDLSLNTGIEDQPTEYTPSGQTS